MDANQLETTFRNLEEEVEDRVKDVSSRLRSTADRLAEVVREHPAATLAGAFALGYLIARLARRG